MTPNRLNGLALVACLLAACGMGLAQSGDNQPAQKQTTIFDYAKDLNLNDQQQTDLARIVQDLARKNKVNNAKLVLLNDGLEQIMTDPKCDLNAIKAKLDEAAQLQVTMRTDDIEASRGINKVLSESQLAAWRVIQGKAAGNIFGYQKDLNLTDDQVKAIRKCLQDLNKALNDAKLQVAQLNIGLDDLLQDENSKMEDVKAKLDEIARIQNQMRMMDISASREINYKLLSDSQLAKWKQIQADARKTAVPPPPKPH